MVSFELKHILIDAKVNKPFRPTNWHDQSNIVHYVELGNRHVDYHLSSHIICERISFLLSRQMIIHGQSIWVEFNFLARTIEQFNHSQVSKSIAISTDNGYTLIWGISNGFTSEGSIILQGVQHWPILHANTPPEKIHRLFN